MRTKYLLLFVFTALFISCSSVKQSTSKPTSKHFETFFIGNGTTQYFIRPLTFERKVDKQRLEIDFTFRSNPSVSKEEKVNINFSIYKNTTDRNEKFFILGKDETDSIKKEVTILFSEKTKKGYLHRYNTTVLLKDLQEIFKQSNWELILENEDKTKDTYVLSKKSKKQFERLKHELFAIL